MNVQPQTIFKLWFCAFCLIGTLIAATLGTSGESFETPPLELFNDMKRQPRGRPQAPSSLFADGRMARPINPRRVAWGNNSLSANTDLQVVLEDDLEAKSIPVLVNSELVNLGQKLFEIHCAPCHGLAGDGQGVIPEYGMPNPPSYHSDRNRNRPDGEIYGVIANGQGLMGPFGDRLKRRERWAIVAYVRCLQTSQHQAIEVIDPNTRDKLLKELKK